MSSAKKYYGFKITNDDSIYDRKISLMLSGHKYTDLENVRFPVLKTPTGHYHPQFTFFGTKQAEPFAPNTAVLFVIHIWGSKGGSVYSYGAAGDLSEQRVLDSQQHSYGFYWADNPLEYAEFMSIGIDLVT